MKNAYNVYVRRRAYPQITQITENLWMVAHAQLCEVHLVSLQGRRGTDSKG